MANAPGSFNVRELLELERQLYQESIERTTKQHEELTRGSLEDFVVRCIPFEDEKGWETEAAMVQLQLNKRNGLDLLEFELKQAEDVYQRQRQELRQQLLKTAHKRLEKLQTRAKLLEDCQSLSIADTATALQPQERKRVSRRHNKKRSLLDASGFHSPLSAEELVVESRETLVKEVETAQRSARKAFNMQHLEYGIPSATKIADDVFEELQLLQRKHEQFVEPSSKELKVQVDTTEQELSIEQTETRELTKFRIEDFVILTSRLTDEEFYGQISDVIEDEVRLVLICGTRARATLDALRIGRCALTHQPQQAVHGVASQLMLYDERTILNTKRIRLEAQLRKKGKRKRTVF